jgi:hypothetical protein
MDRVCPWITVSIVTTDLWGFDDGRDRLHAAAVTASGGRPGGRHVDHPPHPHQDRSVRDRKRHTEFISYSEWDSEAAIEAYRNSAAHKEIVRHTRGLKGAKAEVKLYELVQ